MIARKYCIQKFARKSLQNCILFYACNLCLGAPHQFHVCCALAFYKVPGFKFPGLSDLSYHSRYFVQLLFPLSIERNIYTVFKICTEIRTELYFLLCMKFTSWGTASIPRVHWCIQGFKFPGFFYTLYKLTSILSNYSFHFIWWIHIPDGLHIRELLILITWQIPYLIIHTIWQQSKFCKNKII